MNYTSKYRLPQWEKSDRILMDDFNQAMNSIEAGIARTAQDAAGDSSAASSAAAGALEAAETAQDAAEAARSAALAAYRPGYYPYTVGTYAGNGSSQSIHLGFQPRFVIIAALTGSVSGMTNMVKIGRASCRERV